MNKRELVETYINTTKEILRKDKVVSDTLESINEDNQVFSLIPQEMWGLVQLLALRLFDTDEIGWIEWYLYEGSDTCKGVSDDTGCMDINTFDEFYKFAFEDVTVAEIQNEKHPV